MPDDSSSSERSRARVSSRRRNAAISAAVAAAVAVSAGVGLGAMSRVAGISVDLLFWLRQEVVPVSHDPAQSPTVVVAIDEETYRRQPFTDIPVALWTPQIASVLDALLAADVKVVGFDAIFPASIERFVSGFDRPFLVALRKAASAGKVVLGEAQHQKYPIHPFPAQIFAVGSEKNIRSVNLFNDQDEIIRRVPLTFDREEQGGGVHSEPSMVLELAARAAGSPPAPQPDGGLALAGYRIPGAARNNMILNFDAGDSIPTYSFADLQACAQQGNTAYFQRHFAGKVVIIGAVLDIEDRKLTSKRFITTPDRPSTAERCVYPPMTELFREDLVRKTIPGVMVLATAVDNLLRGDALRELEPLSNLAFILLFGLGAAIATMKLRPLAAGAALLGGALLWTIVATVVFRGGVVLPLLAPPLAAGLTYAALLGYRFGVTDRDKRLLRNSFKLYLAPAVVDRMLESDQLPELGGETRVVTVLFSDLAGFSTFSETVTPAELVTLMNEYMTSMTDIVEAEGGFVAQYIGDAIYAVFGAPLDDPQHALHAVRAALSCRDRLEELNRDPEAFLGHHLKARIGLGTGEVLVGNIGSRRRFNYTAMGDIVNLSSRLEGANKIYGTTILAAASTRRAADNEVEWREIDRVRVVGRGQAESIFEPVALREVATSVNTEANAEFAHALAEYRARRFEAAARLFETLAAKDAAARVFAERARRWLSAPPPDTWDAVTTLETK